MTEWDFEHLRGYLIYLKNTKKVEFRKYHDMAKLNHNEYLHLKEFEGYNRELGGIIENLQVIIDNPMELVVRFIALEDKIAKLEDSVPKLFRES